MKMTKQKFKLVIGILSLSLLTMVGSAVGVAINAIAKSFPNEPISRIQMLSSLPTLGQLVITLLFSFLAFHISKKNLGLMAAAIVAISGIIPLFINNNLTILLACSVLTGVGVGLLSNVSPLLMQKNFENEERATLMGWGSGVNNLGSMIITMLAGILGGRDWRNLYFVYLIAVIVFFLVLFLLPKDVVNENKMHENSGQPKKDKKMLSAIKGLNKYVYILLFITFFMSLSLMINVMNISMVFGQKGHGTTYTSLISSVGTIGGIACAFGMSYVRKVVKNNPIAWGFLAFTSAFCLMALTDNFIFAALGAMLNGAGVVLVGSSIPFEMSQLCTEDEFAVAIPFQQLISSLAGIIAPSLLSFVKIDAGINQYLAGMVMCLVISLLLFISRFGKKVEDNKATI